jgi:dephospho-CoA kinase
MIIGVTGTLGSGKGTVVRYLTEQKGFQYLSVTGFMKNVAESRGLPLERMTYHDIANEYRAQGPTKLQEAVLAEGAKRGITGNFVIEAQHTPEEVKFIQSIGGVEFAVDADLKVRYERIRARGGDKDNTTFEAFKAHQEFEMRPQESSSNNLAGAIALANFHLTNSGSLAELHTQIDAVLKQLTK